MPKKKLMNRDHEQNPHKKWFESALKNALKNGRKIQNPHAVFFPGPFKILSTARNKNGVRII